MTLAPDDNHSGPFRLAVSAVFLIVIAAPWGDRFRPAETRWPLAEKRDPAPLPEFSWDAAALNEYPRRLEEHFDDTFGFRDQFLRAHSVVKLFGLGVSPTPSVLVGKRGWLFFTGGRTIEDFRGLAPFSARELDAWQALYAERQAFLAGRGIRYLLVLVPNKEELYPELLPDHLRVLGERRIDQFVARMRAETDVDVLDLRDALLAARRDEDPELPLYARLGTHWNGPGQLVANRAIAAHLAEVLPGVVPLPPAAELVCTEDPTNGDTWGHAMYVDDLLPQRVVKYSLPPGKGGVIAETGSNRGSEHSYRGPFPDAPRALLLHDSFGPQLYGLLPYGLSELHAHWREDFPLELIDRVRPDVVVEEHVQRWFFTGKPERLDPEGRLEDAFFLSETRLLELELPRDLASFRPLGATELLPTRRQDRGGVEVSVAGRSDLVALPVVQVPAGATAVLRVDYWSSRASRLSVFRAPPEEQRPALGEGSRHDVVRGSGSLFVSVPAGAWRLFLRPSPQLRSVVVLGVELRCRPAP